MQAPFLTETLNTTGAKMNPPKRERKKARERREREIEKELRERGRKEPEIEGERERDGACRMKPRSHWSIVRTNLKRFGEATNIYF